MSNPLTDTRAKDVHLGIDCTPALERTRRCPYRQCMRKAVCRTEIPRAVSQPRRTLSENAEKATADFSPMRTFPGCMPTTALRHPACGSVGLLRTDARVARRAKPSFVAPETHSWARCANPACYTKQPGRPGCSSRNRFAPGPRGRLRSTSFRYARPPRAPARARGRSRGGPTERAPRPTCDTRNPSAGEDPRGRDVSESPGRAPAIQACHPRRQ